VNAHVVFALVVAAASVAQDPSMPREPNSDTPPPIGRLSATPGRNPERRIVEVNGETISQDPYAFRVWLRQNIDKQMAELYKTSGELVELLDPQTPGDARRAAKQAERVVKLSHGVWNDLQMRKPTRERPKPDPAAHPRDATAAHGDAVAARALVREIATEIAAERRSRSVDASQHVATLDKLERLERIGLQLKLDLAARH
jgi:hypothetical protein